MHDIDPENMSAEDWARVACRLTLVLAVVLPSDADQFARGLRDTQGARAEFNDADFDEVVFADSRLRVLIPEELALLEALPTNIRHADVITGRPDYGLPRSATSA